MLPTGIDVHIDMRYEFYMSCMCTDFFTYEIIDRNHICYVNYINYKESYLRTKRFRTLIFRLCYHPNTSSILVVRLKVVRPYKVLLAGR